MTADELVAKWKNEDFLDGPDVVKSEQFIRDCVSVIGGGFHPDTLFAEYIVTATHKQLFARADAEELDEVMAEAIFQLDQAGKDACAIALDAIHEKDKEDAR